MGGKAREQGMGARHGGKALGARHWGQGMGARQGSIEELRPSGTSLRHTWLRLSAMKIMYTMMTPNYMTRVTR